MTVDYPFIRTYVGDKEVEEYFKARDVPLYDGERCRDGDHKRTRLMVNHRCAHCSWERQNFARNKAHLTGSRWYGDRPYTTSREQYFHLLVRYDLPFMKSGELDRVAYHLKCEVVRFEGKLYLRKPLKELSTTVRNRIAEALSEDRLIKKGLRAAPIYTRSVSNTVLPDPLADLLG